MDTKKPNRPEPDCTYTVRALNGVPALAGTEDIIEVMCEIVDAGPLSGQRYKWTGWLNTPEATTKTQEIMKHLRAAQDGEGISFPPDATIDGKFVAQKDKSTGGAKTDANGYPYVELKYLNLPRQGGGQKLRPATGGTAQKVLGKLFGAQSEATSPPPSVNDEEIPF